jgi:hypothetical protein
VGKSFAELRTMMADIGMRQPRGRRLSIATAIEYLSGSQEPGMCNYSSLPIRCLFRLIGRLFYFIILQNILYGFCSSLLS